MFSCFSCINKQTEIDRAKSILNYLSKGNEKPIKLLDDKNFIFPQRMCDAYKEIRLGKRPFYNRNTASPISIGYTILLHNNVEQFERFLITIYHPDNAYCVHIDSKASEDVKNAVKSIVACFDNVFIATKLEYIVYGGFSFLRAQLNCMEDLLNMSNLDGNHDNFMGKRNIKWE